MKSKSILLFAFLFLSACGENQSSPEVTPLVNPDVTNTEAKTGPTPFLDLENLIFSEDNLFYPGIGYLSNEPNYIGQSGYRCVDGNMQQEKIPHATRYSLTIKVTPFKSGIDGKIWHTVKTTLSAVLINAKNTVFNPKVMDKYKNIPAQEFENNCGKSFVFSSYDGALISETRGYNIDSAQVPPEELTLFIDDNDEIKIKEMENTYEKFSLTMKSNKSVQHEYSSGIQAPGILMFNTDEKITNMTILEKYKYFIQLVSGLKEPSKFHIPYFELKPYSELEN